MLAEYVPGQGTKTEQALTFQACCIRDVSAYPVSSSLYF
jgi:hypothetical protein